MLFSSLRILHLCWYTLPDMLFSSLHILHLCWYILPDIWDFFFSCPIVCRCTLPDMLFSSLHILHLYWYTLPNMWVFFSPYPTVTLVHFTRHIGILLSISYSYADGLYQTCKICSPHIHQLHWCTLPNIWVFSSPYPIFMLVHFKRHVDFLLSVSYSYTDAHNQTCKICSRHILQLQQCTLPDMWVFFSPYSTVMLMHFTRHVRFVLPKFFSYTGALYQTCIKIMSIRKILKYSLRSWLRCGKLWGYFSTEIQTLLT